MIVLTLEWVLALPVTSVKKRMVRRWKSLWDSIAMLSAAEGRVSASKSLFYHTFVASCESKTKYGWYAPAEHLRVAMKSDLHTHLVRFRLGNHNLLSEQRRWLKLCLSSDFSLCRLCSSQLSEDEAHVLLSCPYYEHVRMDGKFAELLPYQGSLRELLGCPYQIVLAKFISALLECRSAALS